MTKRIDILIKGHQGVGKTRLQERLYELLRKEPDLAVIKPLQPEEGSPPMLHVVWEQD